MRLILLNDKKNFFADIDYYILSKTKLSTKVLANSVELPLLNATDFEEGDFILINDPNEEKSEIKQVGTVNDTSITVGDNIIHEYSTKTNIYKIGYDQVRVYEDDTLLNTVDINTNYSTQISINSIKDDTNYTFSYYNSETASETRKGEPITSNDFLLCSESDIRALEDTKTFGKKLINKIDLATRDIHNIFRSQGQKVSNVDKKYDLRQACSYKALVYAFTENIKVSDDLPTIKQRKYENMYDSEIRRITTIINLEDNNVRVFGQTRSIR